MPPSSGSKWWYRDETDSIHGPISTSQFISLFSSAQVDGLTSISENPSLPNPIWLPLSDILELRQALAESSQPVEEPKTNSENHLNNSKLPISSPTPSAPNAKTAEQRERKRQSRKRARHAASLRNRQNTSIYITNLPDDATEQQVTAFFAKCGIIIPNPETGRPRVKLYRDENNNFKGEALVTYALLPSVQNAVELLDGVPFRTDGPPIAVQQASFAHKKGRTDPASTPARKKKPVVNSKDLIKEALSWREEGQEKSTAPRIVILKNVFDASTTEYGMIRDDMMEGCEACGEIEKITIFEKSRQGAVAIKFGTMEACLKCIDIMNGRWYDGRQLNAQFYDGVSDYRYKETEEERVERERKWQQWLEGGVDDVDDDTANVTAYEK